MSSRGDISGTGRPRLLIDTTFLLPALGVKVEDEAMEVIPLFRRFEVYYLEAGLLEALWKVLKLIPVDKLSRVETGIKAIRRTYHLLTPRPEAFTEAARIYHAGHRDYIDSLHYTAARVGGIPLLTIDYSFLRFLKEHRYIVKGVVYTPDSIKDLLV